MQRTDNIKQKEIIVIGDVMLDEYVFGTVNRVSPESCCPVLLKHNIKYQLGGAANVAYQLAKMGQSVTLFGIIGKDPSAIIVKKLLKENNIVSRLVEHDICTTKKTRFINDVMQQMFRADEEVHNSFTLTELEELTNYIQTNSFKISNIVLSDYNKGVLESNHCQQIIRTSNLYGINTFVDIKVQDKARYTGATIVKGNKKEICRLMQADQEESFDYISKIGKIQKDLEAKAIVVTEGKDGIGLFEDNKWTKSASRQVSIYDVTGAGDIVIAYISMLYGILPLSEIIEIANEAASIKVTRFGNSYVSLDEITKGSKSKIVNLKDLLYLSQGKKVVFTNGCFDILHAGHVDLLRYAKKKGDILVVGLNSDNSIKRLKGENRPINNFELRSNVLSAIADVDYIIEFDDDTPINIIRSISPHALIKGGDYIIDTIVGAEHVLSYGGIVEAMPFNYNISTTKILNHNEN